MTSANIPTEIAHIAAQFVEQGATILLAKLDDTGGYTMAPMRATIVFETAEGKALWTMAGNLVDGRFETAVGRQHPITDAQWEAMRI